MTENTTATTPVVSMGLPIDIIDFTGDRPEGFEPGFYYAFVEHEDDTAEASETDAAAEDQSAEEQDEQIEVFGPFTSIEEASANAVAHFGALVRAAVTNMIVDAVGGQHGACGCGSCDDKSEEAA